MAKVQLRHRQVHSTESVEVPEIDFRQRWNTEAETGFTAGICNRKIPLVNNIHSDQDMFCLRELANSCTHGGE